MKLRYLLILFCVCSSLNAVHLKEKLPKRAALLNPNPAVPSSVLKKKRTVKNPTPRSIATFAGVIIVNDSTLAITNGTHKIKSGKVGFLAADTTIQGYFTDNKLSYRGIHLQVVGQQYAGGRLVINVKNETDVELGFNSKVYNANYFRGPQSFIWAPVIHIPHTGEPSITHLLQLKTSDFKQYITGIELQYGDGGASKTQVSNRALLAKILKSSVAVELSPVQKSKSIKVKTRRTTSKDGRPRRRAS